MRLSMLALLLAACPAPEQPAPEKPAEEPAAQVAPAETIHTHMKEHLVQLTLARNALINGNLEATRAPLTWLAGHEVPADILPPDSEAFLIGMRAAAKRGAEAEDRVAVAGAVGEIAVHCGSCHVKAGKGPKFGAVPLPPGEGIKASMQRYQWAADRMWEGLVAQDDAAWATGAKAMFQDPLDGMTRVDGTPAPAEVAVFAKAITELGQEGVTAVAPSERAALYADFVGTCGACHVQTDGGPAAAAERGAQ